MGKVLVKSSPETLDFLRADANFDGAINISDPLYILRSVFGFASEPVCADAADMNDDGTVDVADAIYGLTYLFAGREAVPPSELSPLGVCRSDATEDSLPPCEVSSCSP